MDEKILNFLEAEETDEEVSIDPEAILQLLQSIPEDIIQEYETFTTDYIGRVLLMKNIVHSTIVNPQLCRHLVEGLDEDQLARINKIALHLASKEAESRIKEIAEAGFDLKAPTKETREKAIKLVDHLKAFSGSYEDTAMGLAAFAIYFNLLSESLILLGLEKEIVFNDLIIDRFAQLEENRIDEVIEIALKMVRVEN